MAIYENVFSKEFKEMMENRKACNTGFSILDIPCPELNLIDEKDYVVGGKLAYIDGISEPYFSDLNGTNAEIIKGKVFQKRVAYTDNGEIKYKKTQNGEVEKLDIYVAKNYVGIYSPINIHLPNKVDIRGEMKKYTPQGNYRYVDYIDSEKGRRYLYLVPMEYVYPMELCALVISLNKHRAYYKGCKVALTNGHYVYVYSIPYKYRENAGYKLIGAKANPNFDKEMNKLLDYWMKNGILFNLNDTALESQYKGNINLGIEDLPGTCLPSEYVKYESSLNPEEMEE